MRHLSDDEIILLAEITDEELIYTREQIEMKNRFDFFWILSWILN